MGNRCYTGVTHRCALLLRKVVCNFSELTYLLVCSILALWLMKYVFLFEKKLRCVPMYVTFKKYVYLVLTHSSWLTAPRTPGIFWSHRTYGSIFCYKIWSLFSVPKSTLGPNRWHGCPILYLGATFLLYSVTFFVLRGDLNICINVRLHRT